MDRVKIGHHDLLIGDRDIDAAEICSVHKRIKIFRFNGYESIFIAGQGFMDLWAITVGKLVSQQTITH